jgi:hypothetical protein
MSFSPVGAFRVARTGCHSGRRPAHDARLGALGFPDLPGFVNLLPSEADALDGGRRDRMFPAGTFASRPGHLAPFLRRIVLVGEPG